MSNKKTFYTRENGKSKSISVLNEGEYKGMDDEAIAWLKKFNQEYIGYYKKGQKPLDGKAKQKRENYNRANAARRDVLNNHRVLSLNTEIINNWTGNTHTKKKKSD